MRKLSNMDIHDFTQQSAVKQDAFHSYDKTNTKKLKDAVGEMVDSFPDPWWKTPAKLLVKRLCNFFLDAGS